MNVIFHIQFCSSLPSQKLFLVIFIHNMNEYFYKVSFKRETTVFVEIYPTHNFTVTDMTFFLGNSSLRGFSNENVDDVKFY